MRKPENTYKIHLKAGGWKSIEAFNRFDAVKRYLEFGHDPATINYVQMLDSRVRFKYPWRTNKAQPVPPVTNPTPSGTGFVADTRSFIAEASNSTFSSTDQKDDIEEKHQAELAMVKLDFEKRLNEIRERMVQGGSEELRKALEFGQQMFNQDLLDMVASNNHLREENASLRNKMREGVTMTILPGGHAIIIYGGRVLELSDLPPAPGA
jgi:hypothetical protein